MALILWIVLGIGFCVSIWMAFKIRSKQTKITENQFMIIATFCIIIVGGILVGKFFAMTLTTPAGYEMHISDYVLATIFTIIGMLMTYLLGYVIIALYMFEKKWQQIYFVVIFIVSVLCWTAVIYQCNKEVDMTEQVTVVSTENRTLAYFCNIPVQNVSGTISGSSTFGTGSIKGTITTLDELSYWYLNEYDEAYYDSADANSSKIVFIEDGEKPYLSIICYENQMITTDHIINAEFAKVTASWTEYVFYLPREIMQYNLSS